MKWGREEREGLTPVLHMCEVQPGQGQGRRRSCGGGHLYFLLGLRPWGTYVLEKVFGGNLRFNQASFLQVAGAIF